MEFFLILWHLVSFLYLVVCTVRFTMLGEIFKLQRFVYSAGRLIFSGLLVFCTLFNRLIVIGTPDAALALFSRAIIYVEHGSLNINLFLRVLL